MNVLFVHQNFPGQFKNLAAHLARNPEHQVSAITKREQAIIRNVRRVVYRMGDRPTAAAHPFLVPMNNAIRYGQVVADAALKLKRSGYVPDVIYAHPGWGEALFLKDVYPEVPLLNYCEFYFRRENSELNPGRERPDLPKQTRNALFLQAMSSMDWGVTPTHWQFSQHPSAYRSKISILHEGINTSVCTPDPAASLRLPSGGTLSRNTEVVTYVARSLEPLRGFPTFMRAMASVLRERPACQAVIVGRDEASYGPSLPDGMSYREQMLQEVSIDRARVHFLGNIPYPDYLKVLQVSTVHVYLTAPFVLSWSMLESMAAGCLLVASDTSPVTEVVKDGHNGLLVDFSSHEQLAARVMTALENPRTFAALRQQGRETVVQRFELAQCLPAQVNLLDALASGTLPNEGTQASLPLPAALGREQSLVA